MGDDDFLCSDAGKVAYDGLCSCRGWLKGQVIQMHDAEDLKSRGSGSCRVVRLHWPGRRLKRGGDGG